MSEFQVSVFMAGFSCGDICLPLLGVHVGCVVYSRALVSLHLYFFIPRVRFSHATPFCSALIHICLYIVFCVMRQGNIFGV